MGMLVVAVAIIAFLVSFCFGVVGFLVHLHYWRKKARGSWLAYFSIAAATTGLLVWAGSLSFKTSDGGAPDTEVYEAAVQAFALFGAAPGMGLVVGALAILKRRPPQTD